MKKVYCYTISIEAENKIKTILWAKKSLSDISVQVASHTAQINLGGNYLSA